MEAAKTGLDAWWDRDDSLRSPSGDRENPKVDDQAPDRSQTTELTPSWVPQDDGDNLD